MKLLLDLGNTRLKWAIAAAGGWSARGAVAWEEDVPAMLVQAWQGLVRPHRVLGASVVDASREAQIEKLIADVFARDTAWVRTPAEACGVRVVYAEPQRLGVDRFLAMVAAGPVYRLLGHKDLGVAELPPLDTPVTGGGLAFHYHSSGHTAVPADWKAFLEFTSRHFRDAAR